MTQQLREWAKRAGLRVIDDPHAQTAFFLNADMLKKLKPGKAKKKGRAKK